MPATPRRRLRRTAAATALLSLGACGSDAGSGAAVGAPSGAPVRPDTATVDGMRTMTHDAAAFDRAPRLALDPTPLAVLGAPDDDPAYDLTNLDEVSLLSDGRFATRSDIGARVLVFRPDGRGERVVGRVGRGPGELSRAQSLAWIPGDTLIVLDAANGRINRVHAASGSVSASPVAAAALPTFPIVAPIPLADGRLVFHLADRVRPGEIGAVVRSPTSIALLPTDGAAVVQVARVPGWEYVTVEVRYRGRSSLDSPRLRLGRRAHVAVAGSSIVTSAGDGYAVDFRSPAGAVRSRLLVEVPRRAVTAAMRDGVVARELAAVEARVGEGNRDVAEERRLAREVPFADSLPPYAGIHASRDGTLWVVDAIAPTDTGWSATAFRADGAIVGRLHASGRGEPTAFEGDRVAVRGEDEDGVVTVRVHRVRPAAAP